MTSFHLTKEGARTVKKAIDEHRAVMAAKRAARGPMHGLERRKSEDRRVGDRRMADTQPGEQA